MAFVLHHVTSRHVVPTSTRQERTPVCSTFHLKCPTSTDDRESLCSSAQPNTVSNSMRRPVVPRHDSQRSSKPSSALEPVRFGWARFIWFQVERMRPKSGHKESLNKGTQDRPTFHCEMTDSCWAPSAQHTQCTLPEDFLEVAA